MDKPRKSSTQALANVANRLLADTFARQGFAATGLITHWSDIVGAEIAAHAEPMRIQWPRSTSAEAPEPATLVLRVEGPVALEIQHLAELIVERVNRFFGWRAIGRITIRQAPLISRPKPAPPPPPDPEVTARLAATLTDIADDDLRQALARLGAAIKKS
jgi:hypothetical protein